jgi:hypothetical protein
LIKREKRLLQASLRNDDGKSKNQSSLRESILLCNNHCEDDRKEELAGKNQPGSVAPSAFSVLNLLASIAPEIVYHFLVKPLAVAFPFGSVAFS